MMRPVKVMIVSGDIAFREMAVELLLRSGCEVAHRVDPQTTLADWGRHSAPDFVVVDGRFETRELGSLLDDLDRTNARVVLLVTPRTPVEIEHHHAVVRTIAGPIAFRELTQLIAWMNGDDPSALRNVRSSHPPPMVR